MSTVMEMVPGPVAMVGFLGEVSGARRPPDGEEED